MDYNTFSYRNFIQEHYRYNKSQWPPNVPLAELHSRCSLPGNLTQNEAACPCCGQRTKVSNTPWLMENIYSDFVGTSSGICGYFLLVRSFVIVSFALVALGSIYQLYLQYQFCSQDKSGNCYNQLFLTFIDFKSVITGSSRSGRLLSALAVAMYMVLLIANILILRNLLLIKDSCKDMFTHNTLLVSNVDPERLTALISTETADTEFDKVILENLYEQFLLREKCKLLFYQVQAVRALEYELNTLYKLNEQLKKLVLEINSHENEQPTNYLITFRHESQAHRVEAALRREGLFYQYLKYPQDMRWEFAGQNVKRCTYTLSRIWIICGVLFAAVLLCLPILIELRLQSISFTQLTIGQFIECYGLSFVISIMSLLVTLFVETNCKDLKTTSTVAERVFFYNTIFSLIVYIILPLIFTLLALVNPGVGIYVVVEQAVIIIATQVLVSIIDPKYYIWNARKSLLLGNSFEAFKYNQRRLHQMVSCIEYPVLDKLLVIMRICSYAFGFCFVSPYVPVVLFVCLLIIYLFEKRNVYKHYRPAELNISVLIYAFMHLSIASEALMCIFLTAYLIMEYQMPLWVIAVTVPLLVPAWLIKIRMYKSRYSNKQPDQTLQMSAMESPGMQSPIRISKLKSMEESENYRSRYEHFVTRMRNKHLFERIDSYLLYIS